MEDITGRVRKKFGKKEKGYPRKVTANFEAATMIRGCMVAFQNFLSSDPWVGLRLVISVPMLFFFWGGGGGLIKNWSLDTPR